MLSKLLERISASLDPTEPVSALDIERVSATLLVEIARADHDIDPAERDAILKALQGAGKLDAADLQAIVDDAFADADTTVSLYEHVRLINEQFDKPSKLALVEQMWRVALADGDIDGYEEYTIRKICDLLYIKHRDFMQAKLRMMEEQST
ncbi:tellurite resistance TerB family protein [Granulosicoccus sp. 3-233]|uniref:tellurite resistance TerB family protein n=1 Tax=Granulosicoccus sp. 3-233 TaxID=3417969 RepID=UPI003D358E79